MKIGDKFVVAVEDPSLADVSGLSLVEVVAIDTLVTCEGTNVLCQVLSQDLHGGNTYTQVVGMQELEASARAANCVISLARQHQRFV
jgi:hypothetical protein